MLSRHDKINFIKKYKIILFSLLFLTNTAFGQETTISIENGTATVNRIAEFNRPWAILELEPNRFLVNERGGNLFILQANGEKTQVELGELEHEIYARGQGGFLGLAKHPEYNENGWVYMSYSGLANSSNASTILIRFKINNNQMQDIETLFVSDPGSTTRHFGSRIVFDNDGYVYLGLGDRGNRPLAQELSSHLGSLIRLNDDGSIPSDNPFMDNNQRREIYSYGHRNIQGLFYDSENDAIYAHEHGPRGGDEVNLIKRGVNYGWPEATYGIGYSGFRISDNQTLEGTEDPLFYWDPSIAPSGFTIYSGKLFEPWKGSFLVGALKFGVISRLIWDSNNTKLIEEERILDGEYGRIRDVYEDSNGYIYFLTDLSNGAVYRLTPEN